MSHVSHVWMSHVSHVWMSHHLELVTWLIHVYLPLLLSVCMFHAPITMHVHYYPILPNLVNESCLACMNESWLSACDKTHSFVSTVALGRLHVLRTRNHTSALLSDSRKSVTESFLARTNVYVLLNAHTPYMPAAVHVHYYPILVSERVTSRTYE